ncbi:Ionotropic receptor 204 [Blattella germanica]|nr:Ionotropic receptor 204 [Blattella germanica]
MFQKLFYVTVISSLLIDRVESNDPTIDCLQSILERYFPPQSSLVFLQGKEDLHQPKKSRILADLEESSTILNVLFLMNRYSITIERAGERKINQTMKYTNHDGYILLSKLQDRHAVYQDLVDRASQLRHEFDWNPRAKFIIIITKSSADNGTTYDLVSDIFIELWRWKVLDVVILCRTPPKSISDDLFPLLDVYAWFPFDPVEHCGRVRDPVVIDRWILNSGRGQFQTNENLFPPKVPRDMKGCPIRLSTFEYGPMMLGQSTNEDGSKSYSSGIEYFLMREIAKFTNMSLYILPPPPDGGFWGIDLRNGSWSGLAGEVMNGFSDIAAVDIWYKCNILPEMECSTPHMIDKIRWYVPCAKPNPKWSSLTRVFKASLWGAFAAMYVIVAICMWVVVTISNHTTPKQLQNEAYDGFVKCSLNFWAIILEESASNDPPKIMSIRSLFLAWVLYCYAVNTVYQTFLTSFLVDPGLQKQISSEDELLASGIVYSVFPSTYPHSVSLYTKYPKIQFCERREECLNAVAYRNEANVFSQVLTEYEISVRFVNANGDRMVCDFDEIVSIQLIVLPVMRGNPKLKVINQVIRYLLEAGFIDQWFDNIKYLSTLALAKTFNLPPGEYIKLSLNHLQSAFYFMFLGYGLSTMAFAGELLSKKKMFSRSLKKNQTKN